jgi:hypothetical protein
MEPHPPDRGPGRIIFLNGASGSGTSTLAKAMQEPLPEPFLHVSPGAIRTARPAGGSRCGRGSSMASTGACPRWPRRETTSSSSTSPSPRLARVPGHAARRPGCLPRRRALRSGRDRPPGTGSGRSPYRGGAGRTWRPTRSTRSGPTTSSRHNEHGPQRGCRSCTGRLTSQDRQRALRQGISGNRGTLSVPAATGTRRGN